MARTFDPYEEQNNPLGRLGELLANILDISALNIPEFLAPIPERHSGRRLEYDVIEQALEQELKNLSKD